MPLSTAQQEHIYASVGHLFELTQDAKELPREIQRIRQAFTGDELKSNNDYIAIQRPTEYLLRLENLGPSPITIGEVKTQLLDLASRGITIAAEKSQLQITQDIWNREQLQKQISESKDFKLTFKSIKINQSNQEPLFPIPTSPDQIYSARVELNDQMDKIIICIDIQLTSTLKISTKVDMGFIPEMESENQEERDRTEHDYLLSISMNNKKHADNCAAQAVLKYLVEEKMITRFEASTQLPCSGIILTYKPYFDLLLKGKIKFSEIAHLSELQSMALMQPVSLKLIHEGLSNIEKLKDLKSDEISTISEPNLLKLYERDVYDLQSLSSLTPYQKMVVSHPYYAPLLFDKKIQLFEISHLSQDECKCMLMPPVINLHKNGIVSTAQAHKVSKGAKDIILEAYYYKLLMESKIFWHEIEKIDENKAKNLILPQVIRLQSEKIITFQHALHLSNNTITLLTKDPIIFQLIIDKVFHPIITECIAQEEVDDKWQTNQKLTLLTPQQIVKFKSIASEFIAFTSHKLLYDTDLHYIYRNFAEIDRDIKNEKSREVGSKLLHFPIIKKRCYINIKNQIQTILYKESQRLAEESIKRIQSSCSQLGVNFNEVRDLIFNELIIAYNFDPIKNTLTNLMCYGNYLRLTNKEIYELIFGNRLILIFNQQPMKIGSEYDSIDKISGDIRFSSEKNTESETYIRNSVTLYFFKHLNAMIEEAIKSRGINEYQEIHTLVNTLLLDELKSDNQLYKAGLITPIFSLILTKIYLLESKKTPNFMIYKPKSMPSIFFESQETSRIDTPSLLHKKLNSVSKFIMYYTKYEPNFKPTAPLKRDHK